MVSTYILFSIHAHSRLLNICRYLSPTQFILIFQFQSHLRNFLLHFPASTHYDIISKVRNQKPRNWKKKVLLITIHGFIYLLTHFIYIYISYSYENVILLLLFSRRATSFYFLNPRENIWSFILNREIIWLYFFMWRNGNSFCAKHRLYLFILFL